MSTTNYCQRCGKEYDYWRIRQAEINVGRFNSWKLQLCSDCMLSLENAINTILRTLVVVKE